MLDILIEIGVEELPISEGEKIIDDFGDAARAFLSDNSLKCEHIMTTGTPRRITLIIKQLVEKQENTELKIYGPPKTVFFDSIGAISKAGEKYLQKNNKTMEEITFETKDDGKNIEYAVFVQKNEGKKSIDLISENLQNILMSLHTRKKMRWSEKQILFSRPVRWICAVCNGRKLELQIGNVASDNITYGHRFLSPDSARINSTEDYFSILEDKYVIADKFLRKKTLLKKIEKLLENSGLSVELDEELIDLNNFLVEYPNPFICEFPAEFLVLPEETLISTMKKHQKYFAVYDKATRKLTNKFIAVSNMTDKFIENIRRGNERVINARFEDAKFYYEDDLSKDLNFFNDKLKSITYIDGIGNVYQKTLRMRRIIEHIGSLMNLADDEILIASKAAEFSKFDLATGMVYEFPQLQGLIGAHYALKKNMSAVIADSIREHYLPAGNLNELPASIPAKLAALSDKFDTMCVCFLLDLKPTGSTDPYAVRRACRGIIAIIRSLKINVDITAILKFCITNAFNDLEKKGGTTFDNAVNDAVSFFKARIENMLEEEGNEINYIKLAADTQIDTLDILTIDNKLNALAKLKDNENFTKVLKAFKRINNILKKAEGLKEVNIELFNAETENELYDKFLQIKKTAAELITENNYEKIIAALSELGPVIDKYFESIMVMDKDELVRINRLSMLKEISDYYKKQYAF